MSQQRAHLLVQLTRMLARPELVGAPLSIRLCTAYVRLTRAERGAISLGSVGEERSLLSASDEVAARYEDAQDLAREGPTLLALAQGRVASADSREAHVRTWPRLSDLAPDHPTHVHALPMRPDGVVVGVITVHFGQGGMLDAEETSLHFLGDAVGAACVGRAAYDDDSRGLWSERDRVAQATGAVVAQLRVTPADAAAILRAHAFASEVSVHEVARRVVTRELDFSLDPDGGTP